MKDNSLQNSFDSRDLLESSYYTEFFLDSEGNILFISQSVENLTGHTAGDFSKEGISLFNSILSPEDRGRVMGLAKEAEKLRQWATIRFRISDKQGSLKWLEGVYRPLFNETGVITGYRGTLRDISAERDKERGYIDKYTFMEAILEYSTEMIYVKDLQGKYIYLNTRAAEVQTKSKEDILGKDDFAIFPLHIAKELRKNDLEVIKSEKAVETEEETEIAGVTHYLYSSKSPYYNINGEIAGTVGISRDITRKKLIEEQISKLSIAVEQSPSTIAITDVEGNLEYVNPKFSQLTGYTPEEVLGKNPRILKSGRQDNRFYKNLWKTIVGGDKWQGIFINKKKNGEIYYESSSISAIRNSRNEIINYVKVAEDISERVMAEKQLQLSKERLRQSLLYAHIGSWDWYPADGKVYCSEVIQEFFNLEGENPEVSLAVIMEKIHPDDREMVETVLKDAAENNVPVEVECRILKTSETLSWLFIRGEKSSDQGSRMHILGVMQDITERKEFEALKENIEQITRHDLKGWLNSIIVAPQVLRGDENITDKQEKLLSIIESTGYKMLNLIDNSLWLNKIEAGSYQVNFEKVDLLPILKTIVQEGELWIKKGNLEFNIFVFNRPPASDERCMVKGEKFLIFSMMHNTIKNAFEASPAGGTVTINISEEGDFYRIDVHNAGTVPETIRNRFFDKYVTFGKKTGTGLGTYAVKLIAEVQGGEVRMETSEDAGTKVSIFLLKQTAG